MRHNGPRARFLLSVLICASHWLNAFSFFARRLLDRVPAGPAFITLCFVVRSVDAVGFAAAMTSSFAMTAKIFPNNVATVLVSADNTLASYLDIRILRKQAEHYTASCFVFLVSTVTRKMKN